MGEVDDTKLEVSRRFADGALILTVSGELDVASAQVLETSVSELRPLANPLRLEMSRVTFVDSSGLRTLLAARRAAIEDTGQEMVLVGVTEPLRKLLTLAGVDTAFELDD